MVGNFFPPESVRSKHGVGKPRSYWGDSNLELPMRKLSRFFSLNTSSLNGKRTVID